MCLNINCVLFSCIMQKYCLCMIYKNLLNHLKLHSLKQDISFDYFRDSYIHVSLYLIRFIYKFK